MPARSVYALGARDGLWTGLAMSLVFVLFVMTADIPLLGLPAMAGFVFVPCMVWNFLRRRWVAADVPEQFAAVWLHGICIFLFGAIILAMAMYLTLNFIAPGWIEQQTIKAAMRLSTQPDAVDEARDVARIVENGLLPSPIRIAVSSIWLVAFTGSLWSMFFAAILTRTKHFRNKRRDYSMTQTNQTND